MTGWRKLRQWVGGWLTVEVAAARVGPLLAALWTAGVTVWRVGPRPDGVAFSLPYRRRPDLYRVARDLSIRPRVLDRGGLPVRWRRARRRAGLVVGAAVAVMAVVFVTSRVWIIDLANVPARLQPTVMTAVVEAGLAPGVERAHLDTGRLEQAVLSRLPGVSWVGIRLVGGLAVVRVHPVRARTAPGPSDRLVARRGGVVRLVAVYAGQAVVAPGDRVRAGETLIVGSVIVPPGEPAQGPRPPAQAVAAGEVLADVTVAAAADASYTQRVPVATGRRFTEEWVQAGSWSVRLTGFQPAPFLAGRSETTVRPLYWRGIRLPVSVVTVVYNETIMRRRHIGRQDAWRLAAEQAWRRLSQQLYRGARLVSRRMTVQWGSRAVRVRVVAVVREDIAGPAPPQTGGGT